ncbi:MAG: septum formation family protein [Gemmatimonadota bacterium]|nr:septum formation family protein [Gemmatimonadota bacterium]
MRVGDCFDDQSGTVVNDVPGVPCNEPHDNEVYAAFDVQMSEWPGEDVVTEMAENGCLDRFEEVVGIPYEESVLIVSHLIPTEQSWKARKDREILCVAYHMDLEKLTRSVIGSGM